MTKKAKVPAPRRGDRDGGRFSEFAAPAPTADADDSSASEDDDSAAAEPVFPPYAETPVAAYRYDALGRRVQAVDAPSFLSPDGKPARRWVPGDANANQTLAQAPALTGGSVTLTVFAGQNDVAKLDASGRPVQEMAYGNPQGYDNPTAYFRLEKSLVWVAKNGKQTKLLDDDDLRDADGRGGHEGLSRLASKFGRGGKLQVRESWKTYAYHLDRLGSVIAISDAQGKVLEQYRYDPYGKPYVLGTAFVIASPDGARQSMRPGVSPAWKPLSRPGLGNARLYTGRDWDSATKTYWYRARAYSPTLGRFLQRDPLGYADGANPYAYVANSPWGATDPLGLSSKSALGEWWDGVKDDAARGVEAVNETLRNIDWTDALLTGQEIAGDAVAYLGGTMSAVGSVMCVASVQATGGCAVLAAPTVAGEAVCLIPAVTAGASCLAIPIGGAAAGVGYGVANSAREQKAAYHEAKAQQGGGSSGGGSSGETPYTSRGKMEHKNWDPGTGFKKEFPLENGKRVDAIDLKNKIIKELKPNNPRAVKRGERQVQGYVDQIEKQTGVTGWKGVVETYNR